jgi:hypothetical protein
MKLPDWTPAGVLPPYLQGYPANGFESCTPYPATVTELIEKLGTSLRRLEIVVGLLAYREQWYQFGITDGFQWIDGSFMEDIEATERRSPRDVDVVTWFDLPDDLTEDEFLASASHLYDRAEIKHRYRVDAYSFAFVPDLAIMVEQAAYWYGVWAHRRDDLWKGFLSIELNPLADREAAGFLKQRQVDLEAENEA